MLRSMNRLEGFTIGATDGDIGKVKGFLFDDASFTTRYVVVDTGGWLAERKVLISPIALGAIDWEQGRITATLTKAQVEESPEIETDQPTWRQREADYFSYYGYPPYWTGPYLWGPSPYPGPMQSEASRALERERPWNWETREADESSLRDSSTVIGYYIQATDGDLGHVEDFLVDDQSWTIRYMIVDTRNWLPGKKVLVSPQWIERVDWNDEKVYVSLTREQIQNSPEYDPSRPVEREYETRLYGHYGRPPYWGTIGAKQPKSHGLSGQRLTRRGAGTPRGVPAPPEGECSGMTRANARRESPTGETAEQVPSHLPQRQHAGRAAQLCPRPTRSSRRRLTSGHSLSMTL